MCIYIYIMFIYTFPETNMSTLKKRGSQIWSKKKMSWFQSFQPSSFYKHEKGPWFDTVDGWNPAPPGMYETL